MLVYFHKMLFYIFIALRLRPYPFALVPHGFCSDWWISSENLFSRQHFFSLVIDFTDHPKRYYRYWRHFFARWVRQYANECLSAWWAQCIEWCSNVFHGNFVPSVTAWLGTRIGWRCASRCVRTISPPQRDGEYHAYKFWFVFRPHAWGWWYLGVACCNKQPCRSPPVLRRFEATSHRQDGFPFSFRSR